MRVGAREGGGGRGCVTHGECGLYCSHLLLCEELRLVDEERLDRRPVHRVANVGVEISLGVEGGGLLAEADPARNLTVPLSVRVMQLGRHQQHRHAALAVVVSRLQEERALAGVHGAVVEVELAHWNDPSHVSAARRSPPRRASAGWRGGAQGAPVSPMRRNNQIFNSSISP